MRRICSLRSAVLSSVILGCLGMVLAARSSSTEMAGAASEFLGALTAEQRSQASLPFDQDERLRWHFIPTGPPPSFPRKGLPLKAMNATQRELALGLLKAGLSQRGYLTATAIFELETVLGALEAAQGRPDGGRGRDPELYFFSVFGEPSTQGNWGWRVEGHHVSLHFTVIKGTLVASSPSFFGANPAEVRDGPRKGLRLLAGQEDTARALLVSLDDSQRQAAVIAGVAPNDIVTSNKLAISALSPVGIVASALTPKQRDLLMQLIDVYVGAMAIDLATERLARVKKAGIERIAFAWAGEADRGKKHYYRVQGPTFLIEYDNAQNDGNHIHSVWRDFEGDFGQDLLRQHLRSQPH